MSVDWGDYEPYVPLHEGLLTGLPRRKARESFNHLMEEKSERVGMLRTLLRANGLNLGSDMRSVQLLDDWFRSNVEGDPSQPDRLKSIWYGVVNDVALYLGELMISESPSLRWDFYTFGRSSTSYQRHVIMGFAKADSKYCVDIDLAVATYGHQLVTGENYPEEEGYFVRVLRAVAEMA